jgi:hypothetical protein
MVALRFASAPRFDLRIPVLYQGAKGRGKGIIWDISATGVRVEVASARLRPGMHVHMKFSYSTGTDPVVAAAEVVRATETGFAARFINMSPALQEQLRAALPRNNAIPKPL